jgi:hypothetical protein
MKSKTMKWSIGRRDNPQLPKPYYRCYGQLSAADRKKKETSVAYGSVTVAAYDTEEQYVEAALALMADGFKVEGGPDPLQVITVEVRKNGETVRTLLTTLGEKQRTFEEAVDEAGGMWNGTDVFTVEVWRRYAKGDRVRFVFGAAHNRHTGTVTEVVGPHTYRVKPSPKDRKAFGKMEPDLDLSSILYKI